MEQAAQPVAGEGEVVVRVACAAICGTDLRAIKNGQAGVDETHPRILGHEFSGEIVEIGPGVAHYTEHMQVIAAPNMGCGVCRFCVSGNTHLCPEYQAIGIQLDGAFAEYVKIPKRAVTQGNIKEIPADLDFAEALLCEPLSCVYNGLEKCRIKLGDTVLVMGAGAIGLMHGVLAEAMGAGTILIFDPDARRAQQAKTVIPKAKTFGGDMSELESWVFAETEGKGVNVCVTANPVPAAQQCALRLMAVGGRVCFFGGLPREKDQTPLDTNLIHYKELHVLGSTRSNLRQFTEMLDLLGKRKINLASFITGRYQAEDYKQAFQAAARGEGIKNIIYF